MTDRESLDKLKKLVGKGTVFVANDTFEWLVEQAEKVEKITKDAEHLAKAWTEKVEENKKLREALEAIAVTELQKGMSMLSIARKALEDNQ